MEASAATIRILILGGTTEARRLAERLAGHAGLDITVSLAGRTRNPAALPARVRVGGFGGAQGLADHLREDGIAALIDATHPFAARMPFNAAEAARLAGVPLLALVRPQWQRQAGDDWREVDSVPQAVAALGQAPRRVLAALGRNEARALEEAPQHQWLVRSVDPIDPPLAVPNVRYIEARGPFAAPAERALLDAHRIDAILAKNSGGDATYAKIEAARALGIEVLLVGRPPRPDVETVGTVEEAAAWIFAHLPSPARRGV